VTLLTATGWCQCRDAAAEETFSKRRVAGKASAVTLLTESSVADWCQCRDAAAEETFSKRRVAGKASAVTLLTVADWCRAIQQRSGVGRQQREQR
jgi:hypothetical protein